MAIKMMKIDYLYHYLTNKIQEFENHNQITLALQLCCVDDKRSSVL